jgi:hypothetical protein
MKLTKIQGNPDLVRDSNTNSIINTNTDEYSRYLINKSIQELNRTKVEGIEKEMNLIKDEIHQVKELLQKLLSSCHTE